MDVVAVSYRKGFCLAIIIDLFQLVFNLLQVSLIN